MRCGGWLRKASVWGVAGGVCALLTGCHSVPGPKPLEQLSAQEQAGHAVFQQHCSLCHYDRVDQPLNGPSLRSLYKRPYLPSGAPANDDRVSNTIIHGRRNMPPQGGQLTDADLQDLLAYLHTL